MLKCVLLLQVSRHCVGQMVSYNSHSLTGTVNDPDSLITVSVNTTVHQRGR